jgi:hypothetical protein
MRSRKGQAVIVGVVLALVIVASAVAARSPTASVRQQLVTAWHHYIAHQVVAPNSRLLDLVSDACLSASSDKIAAIEAWPLEKPGSLEGSQPTTEYLIRRSGHWVVVGAEPLDTAPASVRKRLEEATGCFKGNVAQRLQQGLLPPPTVVRAPPASDRFILVGSRIGPVYFYSSLARIQAVFGKLVGVCDKTECAFSSNTLVSLLFIFERGTGPNPSVKYVGRLLRVETDRGDRLWHTLEGLRAGDSEQRLHALYPGACRLHVAYDPNGDEPPQYNLVPASNPAEVAWVRKGTVERLGLISGPAAPTCPLTLP